MVAASVLTHDILLRRLRVAQGNLCKTRILCLTAGPVQQRDIHHTVHNHPAAHVALSKESGHAVAPRADKIPHRVKTSCQQVGGVNPALAGLLISCFPVIRHCGEQKQKARIVIHSLKPLQNLIHALFHALRGSAVRFLTGRLIHLPEHARPETVCPVVNPSHAVQIMIPALARTVGNHRPDPLTLRVHLHKQLLIHPVKPFLIGTSDIRFSHMISPFPVADGRCPGRFRQFCNYCAFFAGVANFFAPSENSLCFLQKYPPGSYTFLSVIVSITWKTIRFLSYFHRNIANLLFSLPDFRTFRIIIPAQTSADKIRPALIHRPGGNLSFHCSQCNPFCKIFQKILNPV